MLNQEENMDDLFRRAVGNFPLKEEKGNWDALAAALDEDKPLPPVAKKKFNYKLLLLLLAFFLSGSALTYFILRPSMGAVDKTISSTPVIKPIQDTHKIVPDNNDDISTVNANNTTNTIVEKSNDQQSFLKQEENIFNKNRSLIADNKMPNSNQTFTNTNSNQESNHQIQTLEQKNNLLLNISLNPFLKKDTLQNVSKENEINNVVENVQTKEINNTKVAVSKAPKSTSFKPSFYFGLLTGIEFSQVKSQGIMGPGFHAGLVAGYQTTPSLSIESGILFTKKQYKSDGEYFKPKPGTMPENMLVKSLESQASFIEIPLNVKYKLPILKNKTFVSAGVSSFILTNEKNNYRAVIGGQEQSVKSTYSDAKNYIGAEINLSAGFAQPLNSKLNLRIEPFVQIPIKGMGVGVMPVTSMGVHLILTHKK